MQPVTQIFLNVPETILKRLDRIAEATATDRTLLILNALESYLEYDGANIIDDIDSMDALDRGEGIDFKHVLHKADAIVNTDKGNSVRKAG